jgi:RNA polymerase sigma-70 factor (ECF subfamily)
MERNRARRWTALIDRIADGDFEACAAFYDESSGVAFRLLTRLLPERDVAEDALVDLYRNVKAAARRQEHRNRNPLCWLVLMARHTAAAHLHRLSNGRHEEQASILRLVYSHPV